MMRSLDVKKTVEDYIKEMTWKTKENSNIHYSFSGLFFRTAGEVMENYTLEHVYPKKISKAHSEGDFHIHNLYMGITGYCAGWSLQRLLYDGFNLQGRVSSKPPKHLSTAFLQMVNFLGSVQNEWSGAQAINSIDTLLAPYIKSDRLNYAQVKQSVQEFVYNMNIASRWGGQTIFSNVTLDWKVPHDLKDEKANVGGKTLKGTYADYQDEMDAINRALIEVLTEGDADQRPFTFPIPTYNITKDFDWDSENAKALFDMTAKYGLPYFSNFITTDSTPSDIRSMCCRLRLDVRELRKNIRGGLFGSSDQTGSVGVVTINMPRIGYLAKSEDRFLDHLDRLMVLAKDSLEIKRELVARNLKNGLLPYSKKYLGTIDNHFSTIGLLGMNEACLNLINQDISARDGKRFAVKTLNYMLGRLADFQEETGNLYNLEATPAEGATYRLASLDKKRHPKIITAGKKVPYYTNSTWLPVDKTDDIIATINHQEELQKLYTGGTVLHVYLGERMSSGAATKTFVKKVFKNTQIPYLTITPSYSICPDHGYLDGEQFTCPQCGKPTEVYSRVVGYYRPVQMWNPGKQEEFKQRKRYSPKTMKKGL